MIEGIKQINWKVILGINLLVILWGCFVNGRIEKHEIVFNEIPLLSWGGETGTKNYVDESFQDSKFWFRVDTGKLEKGIYRVHISYDTDSSANSVGFFPSEDSYQAVLADSTFLDAQYQEFEQEIWVNRTISNMNISIDRDNVGYLYINNITITRSQYRSFTYLMLTLLFKLFIVDAVLCVIRYKEKIKENYLFLLGFASVFLISSLGIFTNSIIEGHDIWFHLARIEGIKDGILSGALPVKIQPNWLNGYGFAVSTMYGEILLYIPAMLRALGMPMQFAYKAYQLMINFLTVYVAWFSFSRISKNKYIGLLGSAIYAMSIYRIGSIWVRSGVGEYSAMIFFPLVVLGVWELLVADNTKEVLKKSWIWWAIGYAGMIQTHVLSCEVVTVFVVLICLLTIRRVFRKETLFALFKAIGTVVITNLWFLVPFLDYLREDFKVFGEKPVEYIQRVGITLYQLLSITTGGRGTYQRYVPGVNGTVPFSLGGGMIIVIMAVSFLLTQKVWNSRKEKNGVLICLCLIILACFMSTCLFPWDALTDMNGLFKTLIVGIRRPTRFMTVAVVLVSLLACLLFMKLKEKMKPLHVKLLAISLCAVCAVECMLFTDFIMRNNSNIQKYDGSLIKWDLAISGAEYFYTGTDCLAALTDSEFTGTAIVLASEKDYNHLLIECESDETSYIDCPIFYYRGYQAVDTVTHQKFNVTKGENNKLRIILPEDYHGKIEVYFEEPWYWRGAEVLSLISILILVGTSVYFFRRKKDGKESISNST